MFRYESLQWHTPYISRGKPHGPATAGINIRKRVGFNVDNDPASITEYRLVAMSNVDVPGLFVYALN